MTANNEVFKDGLNLGTTITYNVGLDKTKFLRVKL